MTDELKRKTSLRRKTPMPRKATKRKRSPAVTCAVRGCRRRPTVIDLCITHAKRELDRLCRDIVLRRDGRCIVCHTEGESSPLQWCHVLSRRALSIRWSLDLPNSFAMCSADHYRYTLDPPAWQDFVDEYRPGLWDELRKIRREAIAAGDKVDYAAKLAELRRAE
jgi:hypothetical protein